MAGINLKSSPHRRLNILTGEWVLVAPQRTKRPWQGRIEKSESPESRSYDPECYLCPGNKRANGDKNPDYKNTYVFTNDYSALVPGVSPGVYNEKELLVARSESGICKVVCFSPRHDLSLPEMELVDIKTVVNVWANESEELGKNPEINYVQIFENKGELMGCSNPHPHGQIWAQSSIPTEPAKEIIQMEKHLRNTHSCLLCDYLALEIKQSERIIFENEDFVVVVPFWGVWPFETIVIPRRHVTSIGRFTDKERTSFAGVLKRITTRYDNLFHTSFPYSSGLHQAPTDGAEHEEYHVHMHFYPPLLRSATIKKYMVGYELLAAPQRDITAESSAIQLRECSEVHYRK